MGEGRGTLDGFPVTLNSGMLPGTLVGAKGQASGKPVTTSHPEILGFQLFPTMVLMVKAAWVSPMLCYVSCFQHLPCLDLMSFWPPGREVTELYGTYWADKEAWSGLWAKSLAVASLLSHISSCACGASVTSHTNSWSMGDFFFCVCLFASSISVTWEVTFYHLFLASLVCCVGSHGDSRGRP